MAKPNLKRSCSTSFYQVYLIGILFLRLGLGHAPAAMAQTPALLLPDLQTLPPSELSILVRHGSGQKMLRLTNSIANLGAGPLELQGVTNALSQETLVTQRIRRADDDVVIRRAGTFIYHPGHHHWHFENFVRYELWSLAVDQSLQRLVAMADKVSYCLRDNSRAKATSPSTRMGYIECEKELQGLSAGWIDTYTFDRPGQEIDITGLPDGAYALRSIVDPLNQIVESNEANNAAVVYIEIQRNEVRLWQVQP